MSAKNKKTLLIVEKSSNNLCKSIEESTGDVILSGIFTTFGVRNRNNRIYESADFLKQIDELQPKIQKHTLLGQLDHPKDFEITLADVSHVIESLEYDKANDCIVGKIRLLNTSKGKEAQALIRDGIPLHISSRAAGTVSESGIVRCEKLFTYDLVADPGFENAVLNRVNESYGYGDDIDTVELYDMNPEIPAPAIAAPEPVVTDEPKPAESVEPAGPVATSNGVNYDDFVAYTNYLSKVISDLQAKIVALESQKDSCVKVVDSDGNCSDMAEEIGCCEQKISQLTDYVKYIVENFNSLNLDQIKNDIKSHERYMNYIAENINNHEKYMNYVAENINDHEKYMNYVAENVNMHEKYFDYIKENVNNHEKYLNDLNENVNNHEKYLNGIAEKIGNNERLLHIEERLSDNIMAIKDLKKFSDDQNEFNSVVAEKIDNSIRYTQFVAENLESKDDAILEQIKLDHKDLKALNEGKKTVSADTVNEGRQTSIKSPVRTASVDINSVNSLTKATDSILEEISKYTESNNKLIALNEAKLEEAKKRAEMVTESNCDKTLISYVPADMKEAVDALAPLELQGILESAKYYKLVSDEDKVNFWRTRNIQAPKKFAVNENVNEKKNEEKQIGYTDQQLEILKQQSAMLKKRTGLLY